MNLKLIPFLYYIKYYLTAKLKKIAEESDGLIDEKTANKLLEPIEDYTKEFERISGMKLEKAFFLSTVDSLSYVISHWIAGFMIRILEEIPANNKNKSVNLSESLGFLKQIMSKHWKDFKEVIAVKSINEFVKSGEKALDIISKSISIYPIIPTLGTYLLMDTWFKTKNDQEKKIRRIQ